MAKATKVAKEVKIITVADLATEYNVEGREIRVLLRSNGLKAPAVEVPEGGFGPRAKYQWEEGSKELAEVRKIIEGALESADEDEAPKDKDKAKAKDKTPAKTKGKGKKAEVVEEEEDDEDEDEDEDDED